MLFNSLTYLAFMLLAVPLALFGPAWLRRATFLVGSLAFYAFWRVDFTALVVFSALIDYVAGRQIHRTPSPRARKAWLALSLAMNFSILGFFKYTYFILGTTQGLLELCGWRTELSLPFTIILPLGVSFYTFQSVSYTIDVYRRQQEPVRGFPLFLTYVMFWPQLVAGPILRTAEVVPQLEQFRRPTRGEVIYGLEEILAGLFKKVVLADTMAEVVDPGFRVASDALGTLDVWTLAFAFGFQIYFDFSGYSSIALGSARVLGFHFPRNFDWPYLATSPREFWQRWHISLSSWIRDYLYLPLQGVRIRGARPGATGGLETQAPETASPRRRTVALFLTWFIMGLWHGANWTFALWGLWHAGLVYLHRASAGARERLPLGLRRYGGWVVTLALAMLGWVFFRAATVTDALQLVATAFNPGKLRVLVLRENSYLLAFAYLAGMLGVAGVRRWAAGLTRPQLRYAGLAVVHGVLFCCVFLMLRQVKQFIYFQF